MKKILLFSLLLFSTQAVGQNFDDLVNRTMKGKLTPYDFNKSKNYMILIDTLDNWNISRYLTFKDNVNITKETNRLSRFFKDAKIIDTVIYNNSMSNLEKYHVTAHLNRHNKTYVVEWWFEGNDDKLSAVTMIRK
jgi:hypothetical protein